MCNVLSITIEKSCTARIWIVASSNERTKKRKKERKCRDWISAITKLGCTRVWIRRGHHRPIERTPITRPRNKILNFCGVVNPSLERIRALRYNRNASTPTRPCCISDLSPLESQSDYTHSNKRPFSDNEYFSAPMKARSSAFFCPCRPRHKRHHRCTVYVTILTPWSFKEHR